MNIFRTVTSRDSTVSLVT